MADCYIWTVAVAESCEGQDDGVNRSVEVRSGAFETFDEAYEQVVTTVLDMYYDAYAGSDMDVEEVVRCSEFEFESHVKYRSEERTTWEFGPVGGSKFMWIELRRHKVLGWKGDQVLDAMGYRGDDNEHDSGTGDKKMEISLDDRVRDLMRRAGLYKQAYWRRLLKKTRVDIANMSMKTAIVTEIPFVANKIDRLPEDEQEEFFSHFDKEDLGCDAWDAVAEMGTYPGVDGGYDIFVAEGKRDIRALMRAIKDVLSEDGKWK